MKMKINNITQWKTTSIGILLIAIATAYLYLKENPSEVISIFLITVGLLGILSPDKLLDKLLK